MKTKKIPWHQERLKYSIFFGILTLLSFVGGYIHYRFYSLFFSKVYYLMAIVFGILALYWARKERRYGSFKRKANKK